MTEALRWLPMRGCVAAMRRMIMLWLVALVLVQSVGVLHRVAHTTDHAHGLAGVSTHLGLSVGKAALPSEVNPIWTRLWGEHSSLADCQLFDQACPDLLHHVQFSAVTATASHVWQFATLQAHVSLFERFYAARGPPALC